MTGPALTRGEVTARVTVHDVLRAVCALSGGNVFAERSKRWPLHQIRFAGYRVARDLTGRSYPILGRIFEKDHTTIIYGCEHADPALVSIITRATLGAVISVLPDEFMMSRRMFAGRVDNRGIAANFVERKSAGRSIGVDTTTRGSA